LARLWLIFILFSVVLSVVRSIRRAGVRGGSSDAGTAAGATKGRSPHEVLGVPQRASEEEITSAYRRLVQQYHPDRVADMAPEFREVAERRMKEINAAYEELERRGWK
jgi:preprotein translocase subunit Sec63